MNIGKDIQFALKDGEFIQTMADKKQSNLTKSNEVLLPINVHRPAKEDPVEKTTNKKHENVT